MDNDKEIAIAISSIDVGLSKQGLISIGEKLCTAEMEGGYIDAIDRLAQIKQMGLILSGYEKLLKPYVLTALEREDNHEAKRGRVNTTQANTGDRLSYKDDEKWRQCQKTLKDREDQLKQSFKGMNIIDDDGEVVPKVSISTYGSITPKVTIK